MHIICIITLIANQLVTNFIIEVSTLDDVETK